MDIIQEYNVSEFRGNFPDVPIAAGVDLEALKETDAAPLFVTLPIVPEVGAISKNGLLYDDALVSSIEEQINRNKPGAIFGHLKDDERSTAFPLPSGMWVGAKREGNTLWAKAWVPAGKSRDYMRQLKAVGGQIATSIYGKGDFEAVSKGVRRLTNFNLESLDFAPPGRAALGYGATPIVTAELDQELNSNMDKTQILAELTAGDVPANVREQIIREATAQGDNAREVSELKTQVSDRDAMVAELQKDVTKLRKDAFDAAVDGQVAAKTPWTVVGEKAKEKVDSFRRTFKSRLIAELNGKEDANLVTEAANVAWADLEPLAETVRDALSGPAAVVNGKVRGAVVLDTSPDAVAAARNRLGF